ncbi:hypothetical protein HDV00_004738 [Rhizophlyctis rosea]|nr:hypothetical protein HDV00_004738 [Rhizophlyctis rosea]
MQHFQPPPCLLSRQARSLTNTSTPTNKIYSHGSGTDGKLGHGSQSTLLTPTPIKDLDNVNPITLACGVSHSLALVKSHAGGKILCWGSNFYGQAGHIPDRAGFFDEDEDDQLMVPTILKTEAGMGAGEEDSSFKDVMCNDFANVALTEGGRVFTW